MILLLLLQVCLAEFDSIYKSIKLTNESELHAEVKLNYFKFNLKSNRAILTDIKMKYNSTSSSGAVEYENNKGVGKIVIKSERNEENIDRIQFLSLNSCSLLVTNRLPLYLDMELNMCNSVIDLSGIKLAQLNLSTSGNTTLKFNSPNPIICKSMNISTSMSKFRGEFLGNAGFDIFYFSSSASSSIIDLRGEFKGTRRVEIQMGASNLKLILPKEAGIRFKPTGLSLKSISGLTKVEEGWYQSDSWGTTDKELIIHVDGSMGILRVETL